MARCRIVVACSFAWLIAGARGLTFRARISPGLLQPERPTTREEAGRTPVAPLLHPRPALRVKKTIVAARSDQGLRGIRTPQSEGGCSADGPGADPARPRTSERCLAAAKKSLDLESNNHDAWFAVARLHKTLGNFKEARESLEKGLTVRDIKESHPEVAQQMYLDLGHLLEMDSDWKGAIKALTDAVNILDRPDMLLDHGNFSREAIVARSADTHERLGTLLRKTKKLDEAMSAYREAIKRSPESAGRLNFRIAQIAVERNRLDEALVHLDQYLLQRPVGNEPYDLKIDLLKQLKRSNEIVPWLEQAVQADPHNMTLKLTLAKQYGAAGKGDAADRLYRTLADQTPSEDLYRDLFRLYKDQGKGSFRTLSLLNDTLAKANDKAEPPGTRLAGQQAKAMIDALRDDGDLSKDLVRVAFWQVERDKDIRYETLHLLAVLADKHKKNEEAEKFYREALVRPNLNNEAIIYGGLLRTLWKEKKYNEILRICKEGLGKSQATNRILFYIDSAKAYSQLHRHKEAFAQVDLALKNAGDRDRFTIRHLKVRLHLRAEEYDKAEAECKDMFKEFTGPGDDMEVRYLLSNVYSAMKKSAQSEEQLPGNPRRPILRNVTANNDLGYLWADQGKTRRKPRKRSSLLPDLDKKQRTMASPEDNQDHAAYVDSLGWVLFRQGKLEEARRELERAVKLPEGDDAVLWDHLGDVYFRLNQIESAQGAWERSIRLYDEETRRKKDERYEEVRRKLQRTKQRVQGR
ncbi:MAG: tetratricopeptide repeat protein [Gemmataceae bacterium]